MSDSYRFDRFELRPAERELYEEGTPVTLGSRAVDLLLALVIRHGKLVSKNDLLDLVWPGVVVEENNLQVQVSALRKIIGAQAIVTVPGRGYRFAVPLLAMPGEAQAQADAETTEAGASESALAHLPVQTIRLLGREGDLRALEQERAHRLISILGPGGIGKTSFALGAAHAWQRGQRDGAAWVELAGINDPALVTTAVAQALGLPCGGDDPLNALVGALKPMQLLLVLDNAEHVLGAVATLAQALLAGAPEVRLLVTTQVALKVPGERVFRLGALSVPRLGVSVEQALQHGAVALFTDQAFAADRRFALTPANVGTVIALCERLDGVALAIKLAAARMPLLGLQGVYTRLDERFRLLAGRGTAAPARQQTLLGALDWSHELLSDAERAVFRRLCVFAGGFPLNLASDVVRDDTLDEWAVIDILGDLVERSLVAVDAPLSTAVDELPPRYRLLESMKDYAAMKLSAAGEQPWFRRRHAEAVAGLMAQAYEQYWLMPDSVWLAQYGPEIDNVRLALDWAIAHEPPLAVGMLGSASVLFLLLGLAPEYRQYGQMLEPQVLAMPSSMAVSRYWLERSRLHWGISNTAMHDFAQRAAAQYREAGDGQGLYLALRCVAGSGVLPQVQALTLLDEMARLEQPWWPERLRLQRLLAEVSVLKSGDFMVEARLVCETLLVRAQAAGLDAVVSATLSDLAAVSLAMGDTDTAIRGCRQLLARGRHRRDNFVLHALAIVACASFMRGDASEARGSLADFVAASRSRDWEWLGLYSGLLALLAAVEGRHEAAARLLGHADTAYQQLGSRDVQTVQVRAQAKALVQAALAAPAIARLSAEGAQMDPETVCAWALARVDA